MNKVGLSYRQPDLVYGYRRLKPIEDVGALTADYTKRTFQREAAEIARIDQVFALASASSCQSNELSSHFGQELDAPCKTCSFCIGEGPFDVSRYRVSRYQMMLSRRLKLLCSSIQVY